MNDDNFTLRVDGGTQPRERLDEATVERYAEAMAAGLWDFGRVSDPAVAYYDGTDYWLSDGFHRLEAAIRAGQLDQFTAGLEIRQGTQRDAILHSVGANAFHGWPRSTDDKTARRVPAPRRSRLVSVVGSRGRAAVSRHPSVRREGPSVTGIRYQ